MSALLQAKNVARTYKLGSGASLRAVDGISLELARGETLALVGESGCGKSTLGRLLMGFDRPDTGEILFDGQDLAKRSSHAQRVLRSQLQMVFQDSASAFNPRWTIGSALAEPFRIHKRPYSRQSLEDLLERVGLSGAFFDRYPGALSGGQRQRLNIARAIALSPRLIVADEPYRLSTSRFRRRSSICCVSFRPISTLPASSSPMISPWCVRFQTVSPSCISVPSWKRVKPSLCSPHQHTPIRVPLSMLCPSPASRLARLCRVTCQARFPHRTGAASTRAVLSPSRAVRPSTPSWKSDRGKDAWRVIFR